MRKFQHKALLAWSMALIMTVQLMEGQVIAGAQMPWATNVGGALKKLPVPQQSSRTHVGNHPFSARSTPPHRDMSHVLAATYYSLQDGLAATLMLSNQGPHPMDIKIVLFNLGGERFDVPAVTVAPNTVQSFELTDWVQSADDSFREGSVQVSYIGAEMELGGVLKLVDIKRSLIFDEELSEPAMGFASSRLEGVWWLRSPTAELRVAIANTTDMSVTVEVALRGKQGKEMRPEPLSLGAHQTRLLDSAELFGSKRNGLPTIGGISIRHSGAKGAVIARGLIQEPSTGFSNVVEFYDPQSVKSAKLTGAGLRIGQIGGEKLEQIAIARNVGDQSTTLKGRVHYSLQDGKTGVLDIPELTLAPGDTDVVRVADLIRSGGLESISAAGLDFEYSSAPGSVVMAALSVGSDGNQVFRVPLVDAAAQMSSTGQYPWVIDNDISTFVYITNATDQEQQYTMSISFDGGFYNLGIKTLAPGQTTAFDLRKLRDEKIPDAVGKPLPLNASHGQVHWSLRGAHEHDLIGRVEQVDVGRGMSMTSACGTCCQDDTNDAWVDGYGLVPIGFAFQARSWEEDRNCYGTVLPAYETTSYWWWTIDDGSVGSVSDGYVTANNSGWTAYWAHFTWQQWDFDEDVGRCINYAGDDEVGQDLYVTDRTPNVTGVDPGSWGAGSANMTIHIFGNDFGTCPILSITDPHNAVVLNSYSGSNNQIDASISIAANTPAESATITVTSRGRNCQGFISNGGSSPSSPSINVPVAPIAAPAPQIMFNGSNITGTTQSVVVGQPITLAAQFNPPLAIASQNWSSPSWSSGTVVAQYIKAADNSSAQVVQLTNITNSSVSYYWIVPGNSKQVTFTYTMVNGEHNSASATFNLDGPGSPSVSAVFNKDVAVQHFVGSDFLELGSAINDPGITFNGSATSPTTSGRFFWVQTIVGFSITRTNPNGTTDSPCVVSGLDTAFPYQLGGPTSTVDAPGVGLTSPYIEFNVGFAAKMYWMWQASNVSNSIPVPLGRVEWNWAGDALNTNGVWGLRSPGSKNNSNNTFSGSTEFPTWSSIVTSNSGC
jgi:hypothetical protein